MQERNEHHQEHKSVHLLFRFIQLHFYLGVHFYVLDDVHRVLARYVHVNCFVLTSSPRVITTHNELLNHYFWVNVI